MHRWDLTPEAAIALQQELSGAVITRDEIGPIQLVAGADVGFEPDGSAVAAVAVLGFPGLELRHQAVERSAATFPYVPGLLSFRETPAALAALQKLSTRPDLLLCDGHGFAHPRRFGMACHLGVLSGIPSIGVAKTLLVGTHALLPSGRGSWVPLVDGSEVIGAVVRTRTGVKPVYVSIGHKISLETAIRYVLQCTRRYRLPETTRWAHRLARM